MNKQIKIRRYMDNVQCPLFNWWSKNEFSDFFFLVSERRNYNFTPSGLAEASSQEFQ